MKVLRLLLLLINHQLRINAPTTMKMKTHDFWITTVVNSLIISTVVDD